MADGNLGEVFGSAAGGGGWAGIGINVVYILVGIGILAICGFIVYYFVYKKKNYNIDVEIKIPRSNGRLITAEWAKGNYNEVRGAIFILRKKKKAVPMKISDPKKYVQGERILTVVQLSPSHYMPVLPDSFLEVEDDVTGEKAMVAKVKADLSDSVAWRTSFEREAKNAYSIPQLLKEYAPIIGVGFLLFMQMAGFAILYSKVT